MDYKDRFHVQNDTVRWNSNNSVPPQECLEEMLQQGLITPLQFAWSQTIRRAEQDAFIADYCDRMANHVPSEEEMFEMRSAFGEGETVVNVFTGQKYKL